jgi:hypothetical protein
MIDWISVDERLPLYKQWVLINTIGKYGNNCYEAFHDGIKWVVNTPQDLFHLYPENEKVTHWAEINEPESK